jgi:hypothetical protein
MRAIFTEHEEIRNECKISVGNLKERYEHLGSPKHRLENNLTMDIMEI